MKTFILPGFSIKNKDWAEEVRAKLNQSLNPHVYFWKHWETGRNEDFYIQEETKNILGLIGGNQVSVISKSIGTFVISFLAAQIPDQLGKIIFCGIPLNDLTEDELRQMRENLQMFPVERILCVQNTNDNHGSYAKVKVFLREVNPDITVLEKDRSDHEYPYFEEFEKFLLIK